MTVFERLEDLPPDCAALFEDASARSFFLSLPWFSNLLRRGLQEEAAPRCFVSHSQGRCSGVLLMMQVPRTNQLMSLANYYSSLYMPLVREEGVLQELAGQVAKEKWAQIDLHPMDADSPLFEKTAEAFRKAGMFVFPYFCFGNWYLKVEGRSYEEYFSSLPSKLKNTLKRKKKQLESMDGIRLEIVTGGDELESAIESYVKVYNSSWKTPEPHPEFMPGLIRTCAALGWLRLGVIRMGEEAIAAQLWIVKDGIASIYKLAYDERFSKLSAGSILTAALMQHVLDEDHVHEVDYLTGDDAYKRDWMSHRRERWGLSAYNRRTFSGLVSGLLQLAKNSVKDLLGKGSVRKGAE